MNLVVNYFCLFFGLLLLASCNKCPEKVPPYTMQEFTGREERLGENVFVRRPVYHAKVPIEWVRFDPEGSISDTTVPNVSFLIEKSLKVTVHSFPSDSLQERIPPSAQVARWKRQTGDGTIEPISHGGFAGLRLQGTTLLAWSMQLDMEHYQTLRFFSTNPIEEEHFKQMSADYTIKAHGPEELIEKHREALSFFANSFELIQEIPKRM